MSANFVPFRAFELDLAVEDARPAAARVPEGFYLVECEGCDHPTTTQTSTGVRFLYRIMQGPDSNPNAGIGGRLRDFNTLEVPGKDRNHFPLTATLIALGRRDIVEAFTSMQQSQRRITTQEQANTVFDRISQAVKGRRAVADIRDQVGRAQPFSGIDALHPEAEWETFKKAAAYTQNGPVAPVGRGPSQTTTAANALFDDIDQRI